MHECHYEEDALCRALDSEVVEVGEENGRPWARLGTTLFYPEGGGQPADRGQLGPASVVDVQTRDGHVRHYLDQPVAKGPVHLELDWTRRFDHMQQHTGQHLLTALVYHRFGFATHGFHLGETCSTIDLDAPSLGRAELAAIEDVVNAAIREARPVTTRTIPRHAMNQESVRSRRLPEDVGDTIRLVEIEGLDRNTCGGTHVPDTAALQLVHLLGTERVREHTRLRFLFGDRVVAHLRESAARDAALGQVFGAAPAAFSEVAAGWDHERRRLARALKQTEQELAALLGPALAVDPALRIVHHAPGRDAAFLNTLADRILDVAPERIVVLFGDDGDAAFFLVVVGEQASGDAAELGQRVAAALEARGGGKGKRFQGRGPSVARIPRAMDVAR